ncbi:low temperature requirement protein LtrA [Kibdelosporangium banguiense]|uniref:Low temperature requirement protein LtrA n=1 Tax=Kibdelosporangium banguiense TaxID=1365924 RepID=A0ABS4TR37_9PSEU|nr:low temperature requirement protein A [Kibdelosporangium banguiense]MBP2326871.1 low temperature requirement protein LtrA [Kibdelosporangium banguiense]
MSDAHAATDRHASWLELFFDLVVVVAVNQLAHLLHGDAHHGPAALSIVTFLTLYLAIWLVWTTFTLYSNVVADKVRRRAMFIGMAGIAVMAAAVPHGMDGRAAVFAAAYLITSGVGSSSFVRSGRIILSWSAASRNFGLAPWVVSFWVHHPWWKVSLWLLGLAMSLWASMGNRPADDEWLAAFNRRLERRGAELPRMEIAQVNTAHLGERLGLFVIIVLGEAMLQLVGAVAGIDDWSPGAGRGLLLLLTAAAGFGLLITLWWLNTRHGFAQVTRLRPSLLLPAHFVAIAAITTIAAGLGSAAAESAEHLATSTAWLLCAGVSVYLLVITVLTGQVRRWPISAGMIVVPVVGAVFAFVVPAAVVVAILLIVSAVQTWNLRLSSTPDV